MKNKFVFCLECNEFFEYLIHPEFGELHGISVPMLGDRGEVVGADRDVCYFPLGFTFCKPPEVREGWENQEPEVEVLEPEIEVILPELVEA